MRREAEESGGGKIVGRGGIGEWAFGGKNGRMVAIDREEERTDVIG